MSKVAVVFWSGTGNTEAMAMAVAEGAKEKGAEVSVLTASEFSADQVGSFDAIAFGCPSMGANLACDSVICNETPDDDGLAACRNLGASLV